MEHYTLHIDSGKCAENCTFEIDFHDSFHTLVSAGDTIVITYSAVLNEDAVVGTKGNPNELWMTYGDNSKTNVDTTVTKTFDFDLVKTTDDHILLPGAKFKLYRKYEEQTKADGTKEMVLSDPVYFVNTGKTVVVRPAAGELPEIKADIYRIAKSTDANVIEELEVTNGVIRLQGVDSDVYYLKETFAPQPYKMLKDPVSIMVENEGAYLHFDVAGKPVTGSGIQIVNYSGKMLPETGAMGTTLFITFGMFTVLAAGVLLVTKKRMSMIEE